MLNFFVSERASLSPQLLDSTNRAEKLEKKNSVSEESKVSPPISALALSSVNYAPQATLSAESTYPGYSVSKIKDGNRNTTVGHPIVGQTIFPLMGSCLKVSFSNLAR